MGEKRKIPFVKVKRVKVAQRCAICKFGDGWTNICIACMMGRKAGFKLADQYKTCDRGEEEGDSNDET